MFTCMKPFQKKVETNIHYLPCGKCPYCLKRRVNSWAFRLMEEEKQSSSSHFLTLTYDDEHLPVTEDGEVTLLKRDLQLYLKRLRKQNKEKLKYYACGEYGSKTFRPHYHMILFNAQFETIQSAWSRDGRSLGHIYFGDVKDASVVYTLKYMSKIKKDWNDTRLKEFSLMSKGIGTNYMTNQMKNWHYQDLENRMYCNLKDGKKIAMPRYYKDKIYNAEQRGVLKSHHTEKVRLHLESSDENTPQILYNRNQAIKREYEKIKLDESNRKF
jgi:hypothetical protein